MSIDDVAIEPAATIILLKDSRQGPKVLMQQRNPEAVFVGGAWVFPGGKLDPHDRDPAWLNYCDLEPASANAVLGLPENGHAYWIAAIRELVEEAGILLAHHADNRQARAAQSFLQQHPSDFIQFCVQNKVQLSTGGLQYLSHWITPKGNPKRYDTRFFLCRWPPGQEPRQDDHEAIATGWVTPADALARYDTGQWQLVLPTIATLRQLARYDTVDELLQNEGQAAQAKKR